jgi:hypothetical protein
MNSATVLMTSHNTEGLNYNLFDYTDILTMNSATVLMTSHNTEGLNNLPNCDTCYGPHKGLEMPGISIIDGKTVVAPIAEAYQHGVVNVPVIFQSQAQEAGLGPAEIVRMI